MADKLTIVRVEPETGGGVYNVTVSNGARTYVFNHDTVWLDGQCAGFGRMDAEYPGDDLWEMNGPDGAALGYQQDLGWGLALYETTRHVDMADPYAIVVWPSGEYVNR